jgi:NADPH2 dehydrogenase
MAQSFWYACFFVIFVLLVSHYELFTTATDNPGNKPIPVFTYLVTELRRRHPNFGYLHVVEPRVQGIVDRTFESESNDFLRTIWRGKRWISAGGFGRDSAVKQADEHGELIAFGRYFTSNVCFICCSVIFSCA